MADIMEFPKTMKEFVYRYSFKDSYESYTNNARLIPVFRVEQAIEHYEKEIRNKAITEFAKQIEDEILIMFADDREYQIAHKTLDEIAEEMRCAE